MDQSAQINRRRRWSAPTAQIARGRGWSVPAVLVLVCAAAFLGSVASASAKRQARPTSIAPPSISGRAAQDQTLTATHGRWSQRPTGFSYQWLDCDAGGRACKPDPGATARAYKLTIADVGRTIRVKVTAHNRGGRSAPVMSKPTKTVLPLAPAILAGPSIDGDLTNGRVLIAVADWPANRTRIDYQWKSCASGGSCAVVSTASTYLLAPSDVGNTITLTETASNKGGTSAPVSTMATGAVAPAGPSGDMRPPVDSLTPLLYGELVAGAVLIAHQGAWKGRRRSPGPTSASCAPPGVRTSPVRRAQPSPSRRRIRPWTPCAWR